MELAWVRLGTGGDRVRQMCRGIAIMGGAVVRVSRAALVQVGHWVKHLPGGKKRFVLGSFGRAWSEATAEST